MDGPWTLLWPCYLIWPFFEAVTGYVGTVNATGAHQPTAHLIVVVATQASPLPLH